MGLKEILTVFETFLLNDWWSDLNIHLYDDCVCPGEEKDLVQCDGGDLLAGGQVCGLDSRDQSRPSLVVLVVGHGNKPLHHVTARYIQRSLANPRVTQSSEEKRF